MADSFNDLFEDNEDITIVPTSPTLDTTTLNDSSETKIQEITLSFVANVEIKLRQVQNIVGTVELK